MGPSISSNYWGVSERQKLKDQDNKNKTKKHDTDGHGEVREIKVKWEELEETRKVTDWKDFE